MYSFLYRANRARYRPHNTPAVIDQPRLEEQGSERVAPLSFAYDFVSLSFYQDSEWASFVLGFLLM